MSAIAIRADRVGKQYGLGQAVHRQTLRDVLATLAVTPYRLLAGRTGPVQRTETERFWAVKDVSFEVGRGDVVGVIGRNGAGKSTLLKILSRVTPPSEGTVVMRGRVGSLLEVGTGFHSELTGRENVYFAGAVLGMRKSEIDRKLDEIVAFAEVEKFADTPVKYYSSGMYMRLAFAVAAHLEPDILLVDEVLAVGDAMFQKKCLGRMSDVAREGRTILFVSHNMNAVRRICRNCFLLDEGRLVMEGPTEDAIGAYLRTLDHVGAERRWSPDTAPGNDAARLLSVRVCNKDGNAVNAVAHDARVGVEVAYERLKADVRLSAYVHFFNDDGIHLFGSADHLDEANRDHATTDRPGVIRSVCWVPGRLFREGRVSVTVAISDFSPVFMTHVHAPEVVSFVVGVDNGTRPSKPIGWPGVVWPTLTWTVDEEAAR